MKTKFLILGVAVLALAGGFTVRVSREASRDRAAIAALATQSALMRTKIASLEQRLRIANAGLTELEQKTREASERPSAGPEADAAVPSNETAGKSVTPAERFKAAAIIANDPQKLADYLRNFRASRDLICGSVFKALGLSAEQAQERKEILVAVEQEYMDVSAACTQHGIEWGSDAYKKLMTERMRPLEAKRKALLGDLNPRAREFLSEYSSSGGVRWWVEMLAGNAIYLGEPMNWAQVERTRQVLAANSQRNQAGSPELGTVNWEAARAQLQNVLSPTQISALGGIVCASTLLRERSRLRDRLTAEFKARMPAP